MNGLSSQALALFLVLSPGFLFIVGTYAAPLVYPVRIDLQRGVIVDTAIFVVTSAMLHSTLGVALLYGMNALSSCSVIQSLALDAGLLAARDVDGRCSIHTDLAVAIIYSILLSLAALRLGAAAAHVVASRPELFTAIYGPYFDVRTRDRQAYVIADVMTRTTFEGRSLMYEGYLVELSLNGSRGINFICLEGASRFYLSLGLEVTRTSTRDQFQRIDSDTDRISRITIPGPEIVNLVTRTYGSILVERSSEDDPPVNISRRAVLFLRWLAVGR